MLDLGRFVDADIAAIPNEGEQAFTYAGTVQRDIDGTLAYIGGGWTKAAAGGGAGPSWAWLGQVTGAFTANTPRDLGFQAFPHLGYADYAALRAGVMSGEVTQIAIRLAQNDPGGSDDDGAVFIIPNIIGFYHGSAGTYRAFPAWNLGVDPVKCDVVFAVSGVTVQFDDDIPASPLLIARVGAFK